MKTVSSKISSILQAIQNCERSGNKEWLDRHTLSLVPIIKEYLPSGSGFDTTPIIEEVPHPDREIRFSFAYHHMDDSGYYRGWRTYRVIARPRFDGLDIRIVGCRDSSDRDYFADMWRDCLEQEVKE